VSCCDPALRTGGSLRTFSTLICGATAERLSSRAETRRSGRVTLRVPLKIFEPGSNKRFLVEEAHSVKVSLWGGLIALRTAVNRDQKLSVVNQAAGETAECKVVHLGPTQLTGGLRLVAIEFLRPPPDFGAWSFP
jgi:hypothetical protein